MRQMQQTVTFLVGIAVGTAMSAQAFWLYRYLGGRAGPKKKGAVYIFPVPMPSDSDSHPIHARGTLEG